MVNEFKQKNWWAIILGGSSGLGLASAMKLAKHGMNICIIHRDRKSSKEVNDLDFEGIRTTGVELLTFNMDAINAEKRSVTIEQLKNKFAGIGKVRTLVHSIAKGNLKPMQSINQPELQNDDFLLTINAMALSLYDWTKELIQHDLFATDARIISFTSEGNSKAWENYAAVSAAKASLEAISRNIALEFASKGIRANCIQAGVTDTPSMRMIPNSERLKEIAIARNPNHRLTTPEDVANAVYLLSTDEASWINGSIIPVDGGEHIR